MVIQISQVEVVSALIGVVIGYKGKTLIQGWIVSTKKALSGFLTPKP